MAGRFDGATVVVTGGGSGIGRASCLGFAREGAWVLVADVKEQEGRETVRLAEEAGGEAVFRRVDVAQTAELRAMIDEAISARGRLDVLVNNAGIPMAIRIEDIDEEQYQRVMDVNLKGMFFGSKYAIEHMLERGGGGAIVNLASDMGLVAGLPNQPAYVASKGGTVLLTKALAIDYAREGIRVNCICPCLTATPMLEEFLSTQFESDEEREQVRSQLDEVQPIGRMNTPEEVANAVLFLASGESSGITGVALPVDGGFVAR